MTLTASIKTDPLLFDKLLEPLEATLQQLDADPLSQAAKKLRFRLFTRLLLFRLFAHIKSLGRLVLDLKIQTAARALGFPMLGLSTLHDAFWRYPLAWFVRLTQLSLADGVLLPRAGTGGFRAPLVRGFLVVAARTATRLAQRTGPPRGAFAFGVLVEPGLSGGLRVELRQVAH